MVTPKCHAKTLYDYLNSINWSIFDSLEDCEDKLELMTNLIINGLNHIMPIQRVKVHVNDCPWITPNFKELIRHRQNAFISGDTVRFRKFRNLIANGRFCEKNSSLQRSVN